MLHIVPCVSAAILFYPVICILCDVQVEMLLNWKAESETVSRIKAATLIQKYWYEHVNHVLLN